MRSIAGCLALLMILPQLALAQAKAVDYSGVYEQASPAIVTVHTEAGRGSGFLVTPFGHIATNFHVVQHARYLAVQFSDGRKVGAQVVAIYQAGDMALIKVNSAVVEGIQPLTVLPEERDATVRIGIPVVAIGSPELQDFVMTQGILSKTSDTTLFGDFVLQPGDSGGPLLNAEGEVIGMNTFIGGSMAGALKIDPLRIVLNSPTILETALLEPSPELLPAMRAVRYPTSILNEKIAQEPLNLDAYQFRAGDFKITAVTPVLIAKAQTVQQRTRAKNQLLRRKRNADDARGVDAPFYSWHESAGDTLSYAVKFDIEPTTRITPGSMWTKGVPHFLTFGKAGKFDMEFKAEFLEFRLYRDNELIRPITPGRSLLAGSSGKNRFEDQAYSGFYVYDPVEFMTGNSFRIEIIDARKPEEIHKTVVFDAESPLIRQIRSDFSFQATVMVVGAN